MIVCIGKYPLNCSTKYWCERLSKVLMWMIWIKHTWKSQIPLCWGSLWLTFHNLFLWPELRYLSQWFVARDTHRNEPRPQRPPFAHNALPFIISLWLFLRPPRWQHSRWTQWTVAKALANVLKLASKFKDVHVVVLMSLNQALSLGCSCV